MFPGMKGVTSGLWTVVRLSSCALMNLQAVTAKLYASDVNSEYIFDSLLKSVISGERSMILKDLL